MTILYGPDVAILRTQQDSFSTMQLLPSCFFMKAESCGFHTGLVHGTGACVIVFASTVRCVLFLPI